MLTNFGLCSVYANFVANYALKQHDRKEFHYRTCHAVL